MTKYQLTCDVSIEDIATPSDASGLLIDYMGMIYPHGRRAFTVFVGPSEAEPELRLDIDADTGRAAATWLTDGSVGVEPGVPACHVELRVCESSDREAVVVAAERAKVTPGAALQAVEAYVATGQQPRNLEWIKGG